MCSFVSPVRDQNTDETASAQAGQQTDSDRAAVLRTFFQNRLQPKTGRSAQVRLLVRRTLARLNRRERGKDAVPRSGPSKAEVLRAALMELEQFDAPIFLQPDDGGPISRRN